MSCSRLVCALLSALLPGAGQLAAGARRRGLVMLSVVGLLLAGAAAVALQGADDLLSYLVRPRVLLVLVGIDIAVLGFRVFAAVDAYRVAGARRRSGGVRTDGPWPPQVTGASAGAAAGSAEAASVTPSLPAPSPAPGVAVASGPARPARSSATVVVLALSVVLLLTVVPHAVAGYYAYLSHDVLTTVFDGDQQEEQDTTSSSLGTTEPPVPSTSTTRVASSLPATPPASVSTTSSTTSTTEAPAEFAAGDDGRLTVMLIGTDAGYGRRGARADVVMVGTIDLSEGWVALFGIPRNTGDLPLRGKAAKVLGTKTYPDMISNLYEEALTHPELAPEGGDAGAVVLGQVASALLGIPVDYYAVVDMGGFVDMVDAFGGITLNVKEPMRVRMSPPTKGEEWRTYDIPAGKQHLDGHHALAFARSRTGTSDYDRMRRQRCVLKALLYQNGAAELALKFPKVAAAVRDHVRTDMPVEELPELIKVRSKLRTDSMITVGFTPDHYLAGRNELGYNILDLDQVHATVRSVIDDPEQALLAQGPASAVDTSDCWKVD